MSMMLAVDDARDRILRAIRTLGPQRCMLDDALGRVLAEPVRSPIDWPRFTNSAMDGFAFRWADTQSDGDATAPTLPLRLPLQGDVPAGVVADAKLRSGAAFRIMTGAPVPVGADTVVMREHTNELDPAFVEINTLPAGVGSNVRVQGEDFSAGDVLIPAGKTVDPGVVGLLASFGRCRIAVGRRPRVAIVSTGDELVELDQPVGEGQIVNSSSYMLSAQVRNAGGIPFVLPIAPDERDAIEASFDAAQSGADLVLSVGGVSAGDRDLVRDVILSRSDDISFWKVSMKPGKPLAFGMVGDLPLIGLPGNPVSSYVAFLQFARPVIRKMLGCKDLLLPRSQATLTCPLKGARGRTEFARGTLHSTSEGLQFTPFSRQGSGNLFSVAAAEAFAVLPAGSRLSAGDTVTIERIPAS